MPAPPGLPRLGERADVWEQQQLRTGAVTLPHRLPRHVVDAAVATVRELGRGQPDLLVHGDLHARNVLRAQGVGTDSAGSRQGVRLDRLIAFADHLAEPLTEAESR
ncbi:hypothetical protein ABT187_37760 [Streptomyces sp. NPDC001817]|uniref:hypothetical protein n=1 Tax=Streptomyces sp. NPDC001817 TaxID=3154398 RepID=UPI0033197587